MNIIQFSYIVNIHILNINSFLLEFFSIVNYTIIVSVFYIITVPKLNPKIASSLVIMTVLTLNFIL